MCMQILFEFVFSCLFDFKFWNSKFELVLEHSIRQMQSTKEGKNLAVNYLFHVPFVSSGNRTGWDGVPGTINRNYTNLRHQLHLRRRRRGLTWDKKNLHNPIWHSCTDSCISCVAMVESSTIIDPWFAIQYSTLLYYTHAWHYMPQKYTRMPKHITFL